MLSDGADGSRCRSSRRGELGTTPSDEISAACAPIAGTRLAPQGAMKRPWSVLCLLLSIEFFNLVLEVDLDSQQKEDLLAFLRVL
jgi:hypothetical protein